MRAIATREERQPWGAGLRLLFPCKAAASRIGSLTAAFRPKQQPGTTQDRAEQLGLGLATGDLDCDPLVHVGYPNANAKFTSATRPCGSAGPSGSELSHSVAPSSVGMCTRANTDI
jgi:hypothetical protein